MSRPHTCRRIIETPQFSCFKPREIPLSTLDSVRLGLDEFEAIRLADLEGLYQEEAADRMGISRQTFGNIVQSARRKIADALVNGKALLVEGGTVTIATREFRCAACAHAWDVPCGGPRPTVCPKCGSDAVRCNRLPTPGPADSAPGECGKRRRTCEDASGDRDDI